MYDGFSIVIGDIFLGLFFIVVDLLFDSWVIVLIVGYGCIQRNRVVIFIYVFNFFWKDEGFRIVGVKCDIIQCKVIVNIVGSIIMKCQGDCCLFGFCCKGKVVSFLGFVLWQGVCSILDFIIDQE